MNQPPSWSTWSGIIGHLGAAGGQVNCLESGEVVITLPPQQAPAIPKPIQIIYNSIAVTQMAGSLPDERARKQVQEVALRLARNALDDLFNNLVLTADVA
jgi:hypothetical protein